MALRRFIPLLFAPLLASCIFGGSGSRADNGSTQTVARQSGNPLFPSRASTRQCYASLTRDGVRFRPLPDRDHGHGCEVLGAVQLLDIGVPVTNVTAMRCPLADAFETWITKDVRPAARQMLGSDVAKVETFGTYACRAVVGDGNSHKLSQHALANAVDVSGFVLADGRHLTVRQGWRANDAQVNAFFHTIHRSACARFDTVLSPDYNAVHYNHFHLDMAPGHFCR